MRDRPRPALVTVTYPHPAVAHPQQSWGPGDSGTLPCAPCPVSFRVDFVGQAPSASARGGALGRRVELGVSHVRDALRARLRTPGPGPRHSAGPRHCADTVSLADSNRSAPGHAAALSGTRTFHTFDGALAAQGLIARLLVAYPTVVRHAEIRSFLAGELVWLTTHAGGLGRVWTDARFTSWEWDGELQRLRAECTGVAFSTLTVHLLGLAQTRVFEHCGSGAGGGPGGLLDVADLIGWDHADVAGVGELLRDWYNSPGWAVGEFGPRPVALAANPRFELAVMRHPGMPRPVRRVLEVLCADGNAVPSLAQLVQTAELVAQPAPTD